MTFKYVGFETAVAQLEANPALHARFLNTLSLLEYMGARKILKSQREEKISAQVLAHAAEEIRHAQTFKKLALKMSSGNLSSYSEDHLLCGKEAKEYFQTLDKAVHDEIGEDAFANYLYTTLLIEERANQVYPVYEPVLARAGFPGVLAGIVKEEDAHLREILTALQAQASQQSAASPQSVLSVISVDKMIEFRMLEAAAFEKFVSHVFAATQAVDQKAEDQQTIENKREITHGETQPGLTRGTVQDSGHASHLKNAIHANGMNPSPNHASGSAPLLKD